MHTMHNISKGFGLRFYMYVLCMALIDEWRINGSGGGMAFHSIYRERPRAIWSIGPGPQNACLNIKIRYHWVFSGSVRTFFGHFL